MSIEATEMPWLWAGLGAYGAATVAAIFAAAPRAVTSEGGAPVRYPRLERLVLGFLCLGVILLTVAIAQRWVRIGHGPFINLFELLLSQLWSLGLFFSIVYWRMPRMRGAAVVVLAIMWVLGSWLLRVEPTPSFFPQTYYNDWKWAHIGLGKIFLASSLIATALAGVMLLRRIPAVAVFFSRMPESELLDRIAWRFMMLALIFDSLMLIAGAVWAQDAWGRYWAWDALETSSFLNWLAWGAFLHVRLTYRVPLWASNVMIIFLFAFAFFTYFGVPYLSPAAHKGVI